MLLLAKSCKLLPVMLMGFLISGKRYTCSEFLSVGLITAGVTLFSFKPTNAVAQLDTKEVKSWGPSLTELVGLALVLVNLVLDGFTNAQQDLINKKNK
jgi:solute carrier family 35 (UDP-galactose transporter), member B1